MKMKRCLQCFSEVKEIFIGDVLINGFKERVYFTKKDIGTPKKNFKILNKTIEYECINCGKTFRKSDYYS